MSARPTARQPRGPGWQRAAGGSFQPEPQRVIEARARAVSLGNKGRDDLSVGQRVFHGKFGYGTIEAIEGNKLEIEFEKAGRKRVLDSFRQLELTEPLNSLPCRPISRIQGMIERPAQFLHQLDPGEIALAPHHFAGAECSARR